MRSGAILLLSISLMLLLFACNGDGDNNGPSKTKYRLIFFPVSTLDGADENQAGLYMIKTTNMSSQRLVNTSVGFTTGAGDKGTLMFEYDTGIENRLWGRCEDGSLIPVPMPEMVDGWEKMELLEMPHPNLSADGNISAYFIDLYPFDIPSPAYIASRLVVFNCSTQQMQEIDLEAFIIEAFDSIDANGGEVAGEYVLLNEDGSSAYFVLRGIRFEDAFPEEERWLVVQWDKDGGLIALSDLLEYPVELYCFNYFTDNMVLIAQTPEGDFVQSFEPDGEFFFNAAKEDYLSNPNQTVVPRSEMAVLSEWGVEILHPDGGNNISRVISYEEIDPSGNYEHEPNGRISISHDGKIIIFALEHKDSPGDFSLFTLDREGENLENVVSGVPMGIPVISNEFEE